MTKSSASGWYYHTTTSNGTADNTMMWITPTTTYPYSAVTTTRWPIYKPTFRVDKARGVVEIQNGFETCEIKLGEFLKELGLTPEELVDALVEELV